ncbi:MAG: CPBP family intramembrane glutamic endopeptidase [Chloroflexota bacterium]
MTKNNQLDWMQILFVFLGGFVGVLSTLPLLPQLISNSGQSLPVPIAVVQTVSVIQSSVILLLLVVLGGWLAPKINLGTPVLSAFLNRSLQKLDLKPILISGVVWGVLGGLLIIGFYLLSAPLLPAEFLENSEDLSLPFYTRLLYGGITEEVLVRWGLMSLFVWGLYRLTQNREASVKPYNYLFGIILSAFLFGVGHLPAASLLTSDVTSGLIFYIIVGNSLFGLIAGFLFWKRGLESAILAHMIAHIVMMLGEIVAA